MTAGKRVLWNQGLFLTPQHLQQSDLYHETRVADAMAAQTPWFWGVQDLAVSEAGLKVGRVEIERCAIVTRAGAILTGGALEADGNLRVSSRDFVAIAEQFGPDKTFGVYLAIARETTNQNNIGSAADGDRHTHRYEMSELPVRDVYEPAEHEPTTVRRVGLHARIQFDLEDGFSNLADTHELLKIAEIVTEQGGGAIAHGYVPPCLHLRATPGLRGRMHAARDMVARRANMFLEEKRRRGGGQDMAASLTDLLRLSIQVTLNRNAVAFYRLAEHGHLHPEEAYAVLRSAVGELSAYSDVCNMLGASFEDRDKGELPAYNHERIGPSFDAAIDRLDQLLNAIAIGPEMLIELTFEEGLYKASLPVKFFEGRQQQYYLIIESQSKTGEQLRTYINDVGKLGEHTKIEELVHHNLTGVPVEWESHPPESLPRRSKRYFYFRVKPYEFGGENWKFVEEKANIALYSPELLPDESKIMIAKVSPDDAS